MDGCGKWILHEENDADPVKHNVHNTHFATWPKVPTVVNDIKFKTGIQLVILKKNGKMVMNYANCFQPYITYWKCKKVFVSIVACNGTIHIVPDWFTKIGYFGSERPWDL